MPAAPGYACQILEIFADFPAPPRRWQKGDEIFREGDRADCAFVMLEGYVELSIASSGRRKGIVGVITSGDLLGESCISTQPVRFVTATALTASSSLEIGHEDFARLLREDRRLMEALVSFELEQRRRAVEQLGSFLFLGSEERLARTLMWLQEAYERGQQASRAMFQREPSLPSLSHQVLAEMVGTTRPRVSLFMKRFREAGIVRDRAVIDREKLLSYMQKRERTA